MKKSLYSLMLSNEVVAEIDSASHRLGTNRSALINRILAEWASVVTPEKRINDIFSSIQSFFGEQSDIVPLVTPNQPTMMLKSCLNFKYRPTVRYEVELWCKDGRIFGRICVILRTTSPSLIDAIHDFFKSFLLIEASVLPFEPKYELLQGKFTRSITPSEGLSGAELSFAISKYISLLDTMLKKYICGEADIGDLQKMYISGIEKCDMMI